MIFVANVFFPNIHCMKNIRRKREESIGQQPGTKNGHRLADKPKVNRETIASLVHSSVYIGVKVCIRGHFAGKRGVLLYIIYMVLVYMILRICCSMLYVADKAVCV